MTLSEKMEHIINLRKELGKGSVEEAEFLLQNGEDLALANMVKLADLVEAQLEALFTALSELEGDDGQAED